MKRRLAQILFGVMCLALVINVIWPDKMDSREENKPLTQFPGFNIFDPDWGKEMNNWYQDQFVGRNWWVKGQYLFKKAMFTKQIQDVYLGRGQLIEQQAEIDQDQLKRNIDAINQFQSQNPTLQTYFMLVPNAVSIQPQRLPMGTPASSQLKEKKTIEGQLSTGIQKVDLSILKKHSDEQLYYRTDHHWTSLGAFYGYQSLIDSMHLQASKASDYKVMMVTNQFKGTLAHRVGSMGLSDEIDIYVPKNTIKYLVTNVDDGKVSPTFYSSKKAQGADPYEVFGGGNHAELEIETTAKSNRHLLLFKDSYANSLIPFLIKDFRTITVIDPRYYTSDIARVMKVNLITDVLYCYNYNTFVQDRSLADVLLS